MARTEFLPDGISPKLLPRRQRELFTPVDCMVGLQPISLYMKIHRITPQNAIWFCTPTSLILHPLLISDSQVLVFWVSLMNNCTLSRGDSIWAVLLVSQTQHQIEALQYMWAITPYQVIKLGAIVAEGAGVMAYVLPEGLYIPVLLHYHRLAHHALQSCILASCWAGLPPSRQHGAG